MSGYLARMAARAAAGEGSAAPRLPSRFEPPTGATSEVSERARSEVRTVDSVRMPLVAVDGTRPPRIDSSRTVGSGKASHSSTRRDDAPLHEDRVAAGPLLEPFAPAASDHGSADEQWRIIDRESDPQPSALADLGAVGASTRIVLDSQVATPKAAALVKAVPTGGDDSPPSGGVAAAAEQVVTITIGRVEVRATVAAPPAAPLPVRDRSAGAESLSLQDYLHGKREPR